jgi:hypothetical protein
MKTDGDISASDPVEHGVGLCLDPAGPNEHERGRRRLAMLDEIRPMPDKGRNQVRAARFTIDRDQMQTLGDLSRIPGPDGSEIASR